jgi:hypothetical protein
MNSLSKFKRIFVIFLTRRLNPGRFGEKIRNTLKVLKYGAEAGWRRSVGPIV